MYQKYRGFFLGTGMVLALLFFIANTAEAGHNWGSYHWNKKTSPLVVTMGNNVSSSWDPYLKAVAGDWSKSSVLDVKIVSGKANSSSCGAATGRVEICSGKYGRTGWIGIASVWTSGGHISRASLRMNDTYFSTSQYNTSAWKTLAFCHEMGHTLGLAHVDENKTNPNKGTCMDYTNDPSTNQHPNAHDYDMLEEIYGHTHKSSSRLSADHSAQSAASAEDPRAWGIEVRRYRDGRISLYERDLGNGEKILTSVIWDEPRRD